MIKELIGAIGMTLIYSPQPINRADTITQTVNKTVRPTNKANVFTTNTYEAEELIYSKEYATIDYESGYLANIGFIENRARIATTRDIENDDYYIVIDILTRITREAITANSQYLEFGFNPPVYNLVDTNSDETYYYIRQSSNFTQSQTDFIEGETFTSYEEIANYNLSNTNEFTIEEETIDEVRDINIDVGIYNYYHTKIYIYYLGYRITDNGASLLNNKSTIDIINYTLNYTVNINPSQYEVIDIPGLMFEILGMPFAWLSIAFNFTLFPGTPYAINISHILLGLLVSLIAIIIFRLIMKGR